MNFIKEIIGEIIMSIKIAPSILSADFTRLGEEVKKVEAGGAEILHIDVMDGHFVPNITIGPPVVKALRKVSEMKFDVHLMIEKPELYIEEFAKAGADIITVHAEASIHIHRLIQQIKSMGIKAGLALNPATPIEALTYVLQDLDMVLLMTVNPGFGGQQFIQGVLPKIVALSSIIDQVNPKCLIEVDGGINTDTISLVSRAGADIMVAGAAVFTKADPVQAMQELLAAAE
jgi:ribulose-phosphate 3-epimerase